LISISSALYSIQPEANTSQREVGDNKTILPFELRQNPDRQPSSASQMLTAQCTKAEQQKALHNAVCKFRRNLLWSSTVIACFTDATVESQ